jgi:hypothetical protein
MRKAIIFISLMVFIILIAIVGVMYIEQQKSYETIKNSKHNYDYMLELKDKQSIYLKEKGSVVDFFLHKKPLSSINVIIRSYEDFNKFDFKNMEISNLTVQPLIMLDDISAYRLDEKFFFKNDFEPIKVYDNLKFDSFDFKEGYTKDYEVKSDCNSSFAYKLLFVLNLSFDKSSNLFLENVKRKDLTFGFDKCGFNKMGYNQDDLQVINH